MEEFTPSAAQLAASYRGLTTAEAAENARRFGKNVRAHKRKLSNLRRLIGIFGEPMMLLLLGTAVLYFILGDKIQGLVILASIIPIGIIEFWQEWRTDKALDVLGELLTEYCQVYRNGTVQKMLTSEVVPGDYIYLNAGDKIPADALIVASPGLMVDESVLTGESVPVVKQVYDAGRPVEQCSLSQGTLVVSGEGYATVVATGANTSYGKLGTLLGTIQFSKTPLQKKIEGLIKGVAVISILFALTIGVILAFTHGLIHGILGALTIAIAIIPEEFPIVFSVFLIMGVWRMTKQHALVRQMTMVETLGSVTVICTDKTGTLTTGSMSFIEAYVGGQHVPAAAVGDTPAARSLVHDAVLALEQVAIDPLEVEMQRVAAGLSITRESLQSKHTLRRDGSFNATTKMVHHGWQRSDSQYYQYTAGAPEGIIEVSTLSEDERAKHLDAYEALAAAGNRVIGIAVTAHNPDEEFKTEGLVFAGLLALRDPIRDGVKDAVAMCRAAGIRICMITGDNSYTATSIAKEIGLSDTITVASGAEISAAAPDDLVAIVKRTNVFVRVKPEHKFVIVDALQKAGEIVAMTGDGVNDAPALKKANIGVAMGQKGTEVAREAAGIVLLDDNFTTIAGAVREGRRIYDNLRKAFIFLFTFHIPIIGLSLVPILLGQDLFFLPIHIIFLEFIGDPTAVLGIEHEPARHGTMERPPRLSSEPLLNPASWRQILIQGLSIVAVCFALYYYYAILHNNLPLGRAVAFTALVATQVSLVFMGRDFAQLKSNWLLLVIAAITFTMLVMSLTIPPVRALFGFAPLTAKAFIAVIGATAVTLFIVRFFARARSH